MLKNEKGFSLVEMMMTVAIATVITSSIYLAMRAGDVQFPDTDTRMTIEDSAREALYKIGQDPRHSSATNGSISIGTNTITFTIPGPSNAVTASYTENWTTSPHVITYSLSSDQVIRTNATTGMATVVANDVTGITFSQSGDLVTIYMDVQRDLANGRNVPLTPLRLTTQVNLRNT